VTWPLVRKELRDQRPFLALALLLFGIELLDVVLAQPDMHSLSSLFPQLFDASATFQLLVSFAVGTGLLVREHDDGTLAFLDGLPLTRRRLFAAKVGVALAVLMLYPTLRVGLFALLHLWGRGSLDAAFHPSLLATAWGLTALLTFLGLSAGMLLGHLRSLAWALAGLLALGVEYLGREVPRLSLLDPLELTKVRLSGNHWRLAHEAVGFQLGLAVSCAAVAGLVFVAGPGKRLQGLARAMRRPVLSALVVAMTLGALTAAVVAYDRHEPRETAPASPVAGVELPTAQGARLDTRRYTFSYPGFSSQKAKALAADADATFDQVTKLLPSDDARVVDVDLSGSLRNTAGTAFWSRVRMKLDTPNPAGVLAHETAHVLAYRIVNERGAAALSRMVAFNEGLARWVEYRAPDGEKQAAEDQFIAAALFSRHEVQPDELFDFEKLKARRDENLKYPLGGALVTALANRYGDDAPHRVLAALARDDFPVDAKGLALWQAAFQIAGFDLALVTDDFSRLLGQWKTQHAAALGQLPRLRGVLAPGKTAVDVVVVADGELPEGWRTSVRARPTEDSDSSEYSHYWTAEGRVRLERNDVSHDTVCYQAGLSSPGGATLYEAWQCAPVDWASSDEALER
jgi:hypothetical protein